MTFCCIQKQKETVSLLTGCAIKHASEFFGSDTIEVRRRKVQTKWFEGILFVHTKLLSNFGTISHLNVNDFGVFCLKRPRRDSAHPWGHRYVRDLLKDACLSNAYEWFSNA